MAVLSRVSLLLAAVPQALALQVSQEQRASRAELERLASYSFDKFVKEFGRSYEQGSEEWLAREQIFNKNIQKVIDFNSVPGRSWTQGATKFMDQTEQEFKAVLGYTGRGSRRSASPASLALESMRSSDRVDLPAMFSVVSNSSVLNSIVRDQGSCGSCWAEAATAVLEGHMERNLTVMTKASLTLKNAGSKQTVPTLSSQTIVSCTENPRHCGGTGGCNGATSELAFDMVQKRGLPLAVDWGYMSGMGSTPECDSGIFKKAMLGIDGYKVLPSNKLNPLKQALVEMGAPIAVSVDATSWSFYSGGILSDTDGGAKGDFTVNHAVTLTGYQDPKGSDKGWWTIKNSWGNYWGESGFIRLEMKANEEQHCGWDHASHDGVACDGDPNDVWVCGTCGVLYDSSYPTGAHIYMA